MTFPTDTFQITLVQMNSTDSVGDNFQKIKTLLSEKSDALPSRLIVFPENSLFMKIKKSSETPNLDLTNTVFSQLRELCAHYNTNMLLTAPIQEGGKAFNATVFVSPDSSPEILYRKIHLFDTSLEGHQTYKESRQFSSGKSPFVWHFKGWKFGLSICYDLRFAELYSFYAKEEVDILLIPSAFLRTTGKKHWHTLLKARAIEGQCYVMAPAQSGRHQSIESQEEERWTYGHSLAISPGGEILLDMKEKAPALQTLCLKKAELKAIRKQIPMAQHRRLKFSLASS
ncbi:MAG: carbon-nitrogen hydrolase family protein [Bdellovibrionales bacterium]|nr:carbon-nitrogen hydrolase family protein [Bdellovibrionales bacterium]